MSTSRRSVRESDLQSKVKELFEQTFPELKIIRLNSGLAKALYGGHMIHLAPKGTPDLVVPSLNLWVEMKKPGKPLEPEQMAWRDWAKDHGVPHIVCDSPDDLIAIVRRMRGESAALQTVTADTLRQDIDAELSFSPCSNEYGYQDQLDQWLQSTNKFARREVQLSKSDRVDFLVEGVAVELKVKCSTNEILRQLSRYAQHDEVREILLLSVTRAPLLKLPSTLNGKPVRGLHIGRIL